MVLNNMPKVSICIPAFNYAHFLADAIDSVLAQTYQDFELLVIDNCSTDNTKDVVGEYMSTDSRIRYVCNESNIGPVKNLNRCLELASGEYVKILCADDMLSPACLERMVAVLEQYPDVSLVASARKVVSGNLEPISRLAFSFHEEHLPGTAVINKCLFSGNLIGEPSAAMFRRSDALRGFNCGYAQLVDLEMWFYLLEQGDFAFLPEQLCLFRQHEAQRTNTNMNTFNFLVDEEKLFNDYLAKPYISVTPLKKFKYRFITAWNIWQHRKTCGDPNVVREYMDRYINRYLFFALLLPATAVKTGKRFLGWILVSRG